MKGDDIEILHLDANLVAIHKPSGLLVHRSPIDRRETRFALQWVRDRLGRRVYPVHRLDKPTSGVLVFALDPETARWLTAELAAGAVRKTYLAVVRGYTEPVGRIDSALREEPDPLIDGPGNPDKAPQPAVTEYRRLAEVELPVPIGRYPSARFSLLELHPRTGRRHQIRRHLKHVFHPIVGDTTHGDGRQNRLFRDRFDNRRLLLAATALQLRHPSGGAPLLIRASPAPDFRRIVEMLGWGDVVESAVAAGIIEVAVSASSPRSVDGPSAV